MAVAALQSCALEEPFGLQGEGELSMRLVIDSDVTRAQLNEQELADKCVVYISGSKGLMRKYVGLSNLPERETLAQGHYVAEAWTGDSVPASFDSKFYRGYQPFDVSAGLNEVKLTCGIMNVVASIDAATIDESLIKDFSVTVENSTGSLTFDAGNYRDAKGYFMMPFGADGVRESSLKVTVMGSNIAGDPFVKEKVITDVKSAHEYVLGVSYNPENPDPEGGGYITITVDERENLVSDTVAIFAAPAIDGVDFDIEKQIVGNPGQFAGEKVVKVIAFNEIRSFTLQCIDMASLNLPAQQIDLKNCTDEIKSTLNSAGITWDKTVTPVTGYDGIMRQLSYIRFSSHYLNNLPERATEYIIRLTATDGSGKTTTRDLRIAVGEEAIVYDDPIIVDDPVDPNNLMAVGSRSATLTVSLNDESVVNPGVRYREEGTSAWLTVPIAARRASAKYTVTLTGLKPSTRYEYQAVAEGFVSESMYLSTESEYVIPNASLEEWGTYTASTMLGKRTVIFPGTSRDTNFWDSGNEGAATANKVVLDKSSDMVGSGQYSARLASTAALGIIAAGNMFSGSYVKTDGTDGVLSLGREYDGSHPAKVRVKANYRPGGSVTIKSGNEKYVDITEGGNDHGQIYVALTTAPIEIRTKASNRKLFPATKLNEDGEAAEDYDKVVAYGQVTWDAAFGPDGGLATVEIPFEYHDIARTQKPRYLVIVASASKFGDFYCGSSSSVMYLDDFELVYE